jgi:hypothetical protein
MLQKAPAVLEYSADTKLPVLWFKTNKSYRISVDDLNRISTNLNILDFSKVKIEAEYIPFNPNNGNTYFTIFGNSSGLGVYYIIYYGENANPYPKRITFRSENININYDAFKSNELVKLVIDFTARTFKYNNAIFQMTFTNPTFNPANFQFNPLGGNNSYGFCGGFKYYKIFYDGVLIHNYIAAKDGTLRLQDTITGDMYNLIGASYE